MIELQIYFKYINVYILMFLLYIKLFYKYPIFKLRKNHFFKFFICQKNIFSLEFLLKKEN